MPAVFIQRGSKKMSLYGQFCWEFMARKRTKSKEMVQLSRERGYRNNPLQKVWTRAKFKQTNLTTREMLPNQQRETSKVISIKRGMIEINWYAATVTWQGLTPWGSYRCNQCNYSTNALQIKTSAVYWKTSLIISRPELFLSNWVLPMTKPAQ